MRRHFDGVSVGERDLGDEITVEAAALLLLRRRRMIVGLSVAGAFAGAIIGLTSRRVYESAATFVPQSGAPTSLAGLSAAASQLGIAIPAARGDVWGPPVYIELLQSRDILEPIARDTVTVAEESGRRAVVMDLLEVSPELAADRRAERAVLAMRKVIDAGENKRVGGVTVTVTTKWASVSYALAERVVRDVNEFNVVIRKSQAAEERRFAEGQVAEAQKALRAAEDALQEFQSRNRVTTTPNLKFQEDRLQRQINLRQAVYTTLMQSLEEARLREVRDTPVISVLTSPRLPAAPKGRGVAMKAILGIVVGTVIAVLLALVSEAMAAARRSTNEETRELLRLVAEATPRFLRRG